MTASYPAALKTYTTKVDGIDYVKAADVNSLQEEVVAIETELGTAARTSTLPAGVGTYSASGTNTTVSDRVKNLEAGLTANATDGSRVGYTLLYTGNLSASTGALSVSSSYSKFVFQLVVGNGSAVNVTLTTNGATGNSKYTYNNYGTATPVTSTTGGTTLPISNTGTLLGTANDTIVAEILGTTYRLVTWSNSLGFGQGTLNVGTTALSSITISAGTYPTGSTYYIWGVK